MRSPKDRAQAGITFPPCRETAITRKNEQKRHVDRSGSNVGGDSTVVAQVGLGRHFSGPPHGRIVGRFHDREEAAVTNVRSRLVRRFGNLSAKSTRATERDDEKRI